MIKFNIPRNKKIYIDFALDILLIFSIKFLLFLLLDSFLQRGDPLLSTIDRLIYMAKWSSFNTLIIYFLFRLGGLNSIYVSFKEKFFETFKLLKFYSINFLPKERKYYFLIPLYLSSLFLIISRMYTNGIIYTNTFPIANNGWNLGFPGYRHIFLVVVLFSLFNYISYEISKIISKRFFSRFLIYSSLTLSPYALEVLISNPWKDFMGRWLVITSIFLLFFLVGKSQKDFHRFAIPISFLIGLTYPLRKEVILVCFILILFCCVIYKNFKSYFNKKLFLYLGFFVIGYCPKGVCINTYSSCIHTSAMSTLMNLDTINLSNYITSITPSLMDIEIYKFCQFLGFNNSISGGYIPHLLGALNSNEYLSLFFSGLDYIFSLPSLSFTLFLTIFFGSYVSFIAPALFVVYIFIKLITIFFGVYLIACFK